MDTNLLSNSIKSSAYFTFTFEGESAIDASLLGLTLSNISYIANKVVENDPLQPQFQLKVNAFEKGSFAIIFQTLLACMGQLSTLTTIQDAASVFDIFKGMFDIKMALKGNKPKKITDDAIKGYVMIDTPDGTHIQAPTGSRIVIDRPDIDQKISQIAQAARLNNPQNGFRLSSGSNSFSYNSEAVQDIALPICDTDRVPYEKRKVVAVSLPIVKIVFLGNSAWTFRYMGKNINASIDDTNFLNLVQQGQVSYKAGDQLDVDLLIIEKYTGDDELYGVSYRVTRVHGVYDIPKLATD